MAGPECGISRSIGDRSTTKLSQHPLSFRKDNNMMIYGKQPLRPGLNGTMALYTCRMIGYMLGKSAKAISQLIPCRKEIFGVPRTIKISNMFYFSFINFDEWPIIARLQI